MRLSGLYLINDAVTNSEYTSNEVVNELKSMRKEAVVVYFKGPSWYLPRENEKKPRPVSVRVVGLRV